MVNINASNASQPKAAVPLVVKIKPGSSSEKGLLLRIDDINTVNQYSIS